MLRFKGYTPQEMDKLCDTHFILLDYHDRESVLGVAATLGDVMTFAAKNRMNVQEAKILPTRIFFYLEYNHVTRSLRRERSKSGK